MNFDVHNTSSVITEYQNIPKIPSFVLCDELPMSKRAKKYPLQLTTPHSRYRTHSQFFNIKRMKSMYKHEVWINRQDAKDRNIEDGEMVRIFNDRGAIVVAAKLTDSMMPGVVRCHEGAWYDPDERGVDRGGCVNVLIDDMLTSPGGASNCNTCLVEIQNEDEEE
jgi:anaerobic dimethyl sulfoxide reductase subunit A